MQETSWQSDSLPSDSSGLLSFCLFPSPAHSESDVLGAPSLGHWGEAPVTVRGPGLRAQSAQEALLTVLEKQHMPAGPGHLTRPAVQTATSARSVSGSTHRVSPALAPAQ